MRFTVVAPSKSVRKIVCIAPGQLTPGSSDNRAIGTALKGTYKYEDDSLVGDTTNTL